MQMKPETILWKLGSVTPTSALFSSSKRGMRCLRENTLISPRTRHDHSLAKFSGYMQLGDIFAILGQIDCSLECYVKGLEVQKKALGQNDPRVGETCRYLAEAYLQAVQFEEAERLCKMALDIHKQKGDLASSRKPQIDGLWLLYATRKEITRPHSST
uniref:Uncharacterized protein n=1 Tax=Ananas comosus var. bracteatus TaxID=296719 RepID=A0A6V7PU08_ANACO|nr:unnamed protein product [Ananas comosus var. bracteatus]